MSELDQALEAYVKDEGQQEHYYQLILDSDFYIPLQADDSEIPLDQRESVRPLVLKAEKKHYMLLFDSEKRLNSWAKQPTPYVILAGSRAAIISTPELHWAINLGSGYAKEMVPEEISYLEQLTAEKE